MRPRVLDAQGRAHSGDHAHGNNHAYIRDDIHRDIRDDT
jgi:hypothetical protein